MKLVLKKKKKPTLVLKKKAQPEKKGKGNKYA